MESSHSSPGAQDAAPTCVRLNFRPYARRGTLSEVNKACALMGIEPAFFLEQALRRGLAGLEEIKTAQVAEQNRVRIERLHRRTLYRHRKLL